LPLAAAVAIAVVPARSHAPSRDFGAIESREHRGDDDLLTAGLGAAGLSSPVPPVFADAAQPTPAELRRRAIWSNWRGIADLAPGAATAACTATWRRRRDANTTPSRASRARGSRTA
jgi:hydroxybutyrate-dimer hydrolase